MNLTQVKGQTQADVHYIPVTFGKINHFTNADETERHNLIHDFGDIFF